MPKIRDLGINVIPATMRPPEIGKGAYYLGGGPPCPDPSGGAGGPCDLSGPQPPCDPSRKPPCGNSVKPPCGAASGPPPCGDPSGGATGPTGPGGGKRTAGLGADAIAQLRQQMQGRLGARF